MMISERPVRMSYFYYKWIWPKTNSATTCVYSAGSITLHIYQSASP